MNLYRAEQRGVNTALLSSLNDATQAARLAVDEATSRRSKAAINEIARILPATATHLTVSVTNPPELLHAMCGDERVDLHDDTVQLVNMLLVGCDRHYLAEWHSWYGKTATLAFDGDAVARELESSAREQGVLSQHTAETWTQRRRTLA